MPTLTLKVAAPQAVVNPAALARALTDITARTLGKRPEVTAVVIEPLAASAWFVGALAVARPTALLRITVTAGTNTADQKAAFIAAAFDELQRQLAPDGGLEDASYVTVDEVPGTDWGYGGQTQHARHAMRPPV
jgi:4-oxalocrotonate tautomerase